MADYTLSKTASEIEACLTNAQYAAPYVYVTAYGAVGDGLTDDSTAINAALTAAPDGGIIVFPEGNYLSSSKLYQKDKDLTLLGMGTVTITLNNTDSPFGMHFVGSQITTGNLTANSAALTTTVTIADASLVQAGDIIDIFNTVHWCTDYDATLGQGGHYGQYTGELYEVKSVNTGTGVITLTEPLLRAYNTTDTAQVIVYRPISIKMYNIRIIDSDSTGERQAIVIYYGKDCKIEKCYVKDSGLAAINFYGAYRALVNDCEIHDSVRVGSGYGVVTWGGTSYITVKDCHIENCRHCVCANGSYYNTLNRGIVIEGNTLIGASTSPGWTVINAHVDTIDYTVRNNFLYPRTGNYCFSDGALFTTFEGNTVNGGANASVGGGIQSLGNIVDASSGVRIIRNNTFLNVDYSFLGKTTSGYKQLIFEDNTQVGGIYGVVIPTDYSEYYSHVDINNNRLHDIDYPILLYLKANSCIVDIQSNKLIGTDITGITLNSSGYTNGPINIKNNYVSYAQVSAGRGISLTAITYAKINNNDLDDLGSGAYGVYEYAGCDYNFVRYNYIDAATDDVYQVGAHSAESDND